ncbi:MAG: hypothetical protein KDA96_04830 [Planctomycetaceae bacterium]|nr:hypothetical protein [Planctomycetaceae bacterium]
MTLTFETIRSQNSAFEKARTIRRVRVNVCPYGRPASAELFSDRCQLLLRQLREYLLSS